MSRFCCKVSVFKELINSRPNCVCVVCNRCLCGRSVGAFNRNKFCAISDDVFSLVFLFDNNFYICKTCGKKLTKHCIPWQVVCNMFEVCILVARRLMFKKISIMSKVQSPKLKGTLRNIPIDVVDACKILPCLVDSNDIIIVKLKRKLQYRGHIYFESARPNFILRFLQYLELRIQYTPHKCLLKNANFSIKITNN